MPFIHKVGGGVYMVEKRKCNNVDKLPRCWIGWWRCIIVKPEAGEYLSRCGSGTGSASCMGQEIDENGSRVSDVYIHIYANKVSDLIGAF